MSKNKTARDNRNFIFFSSESILSDRLRDRLARFYQDSSLRIIAKQCLPEQGKRLVFLAEEARVLRQREVLEEISERLIGIPLLQFQSIGSHYKAHCLKLEGRTEEALVMFEKVAESVPASYRSRVMQSIGATYADRADYDSARRFLTEASQMACRNEFANPIAFLQSQWWLGILQNIDGDHQSSLARFERLQPLVKMVASMHPVMWFDYQNGLAVELMEVGRLEEAERASRIALASPFALVYPEWRETARDIAAKTRRASRSLVSLSSASSDVEPVNAITDAHLSSIASESRPAARELTVISSSLPIQIASRLRDLPADEKLSRLAKMVRDLGLCDYAVDSIEGDDPSCQSNKPEKPDQMDVQSQSDLENVINLWANHEITPEAFAAVMLALADCQDYVRFEEISFRMVRYTFFESDDCTRSEREWREKVAREIDLDSLDLEKTIRLWFMGNITPDQLGSVIVQLDACPDSRRRAQIIDRLVHCAFLEATTSGSMSEDEWRRKMKARVKPIAV